MRILWYSNAIFSKTGYGIQTALFIPRLQQAGHQVHERALAGAVRAHQTGQPRRQQLAEVDRRRVVVDAVEIEVAERPGPLGDQAPPPLVEGADGPHQQRRVVPVGQDIPPNALELPGHHVEIVVIVSHAQRVLRTQAELARALDDSQLNPSRALSLLTKSQAHYRQWPRAYARRLTELDKLGARLAERARDLQTK